MTANPFLFLALFALPLLALPSLVSAYSCGISTYNSIQITSCQSINITNPNGATGSNFQQMAYSTPQNPLFGNWLIYDTATSSPLYAWAESTNTIWVKLPSGVGSATSYNSIRIEYATTGNFMASGNGYTGEAPQLSGTYGQYDNGASVFGFYDNFISPSLSAKWTKSGSGTVTVSNGITMTGTIPTYIYTSTTYNSMTSIVDFYGYGASGTSYSDWGYINSGYVDNYGIRAHSSTYYLDQYNGAGSDTAFSPATPSFSSNGLFSFYSTATAGVAQYNYITQATSSTDFTYIPSANIAIRNAAGGTASTTYVQWIRTRTYPPSGVMPTITYGTIYSAASTTLTFSPSNSVAYGNLPITATAACATGDSCAVDYPSLGTHVCTGTTSCTYTIPIGSPPNVGSYVFYANDITSANATSMTLTINKDNLILAMNNCGNQNLPYSCNTIAYFTATNTVLAEQQNTATLYLNGASKGTTTSATNTVSNMVNSIGAFAYTFNSPGSANYNSNTVSAYFSAYALVYLRNTTANPAVTFPSLTGIPACAANTLGGACTGNDVIGGSHTLLSNLLVYGNVILSSGATLTSNGFFIIDPLVGGTFNGIGATLNTGTESNGGAGGVASDGTGGGNVVYSYAGSGAGGGEGAASSGGAGGNTLAVGGTKGQPNAGNGATPSAPAPSPGLILNCLERNIGNCLNGGGGAGGGGSNGAGGGGAGGGGAYGIYIQADNVYAPSTIGCNGAAGASSGAGGGGGGGGCVIFIAYRNAYVAGAYSYSGGSYGIGGYGNGGTGGNGQVVTYQYSTAPLTPVGQTYPLKLATAYAANSVTYGLSILYSNLTTVPVVSGVHLLNYSPPANQLAGWYTYNVLESDSSTGTSTSIIFSVNTSMTDITAMTPNTPQIQYFQNIDCLSFAAGNPTSYSIQSDLAANQHNTNQTGGTCGAVWSNANLTFMPKVTLNYGWTSFAANIANNPAIASVTQSTCSGTSSIFSTTSNAPCTREIIAASTYDQRTFNALNTSTTMQITALIDNYSLTNQSTVSGNVFRLYVAVGGYSQSPPVSITASLVSTAASHFPAQNNYCPTVLSGANYLTLKPYLVDLNGSLYTMNIYQGYTMAGVGDYLWVMSGTSNGLATNVQQYKITNNPFAAALENGASYGFRFYSPSCSYISSSNYSIWTNPITLNLPNNASAPNILLTNATAKCYKTPTAGNTMSVTCSGSDSHNIVNLWNLQLQNVSSINGWVTFNTVTASSASFSQTWTGISNTTALQVSIIGSGPGVSVPFVFEFNQNTVYGGLGTAARGFICIVFLLVGLGLGVAGSTGVGESIHAPSTTCVIEAFMIALLWFTGISSFIPTAVQVVLIIVLIFIAVQAHKHEGE